MECKEIQERLSAYIDSIISADEMALIDKHLKSCQRCKEFFYELKKTVEHLKNLEEMEPPSWLAQKVMAKVKAEPEQKKGIFQRLFYPLHIKLPIEAVAAIFIAVTAVYLYQAIEPQKRVAQAPTEQITTQTQLQRKDIAQPSTPDNPPISPISKGGLKGDLEKKGERGFEKEKPAPAETAKKEKSMKSAEVSVKEEAKQKAAATEPELKRALADESEEISVSSAILDFEFRDTAGLTYRSTNLLQQLKERYNTYYSSTIVILVETPSLKDANYIKQMNILKSLDAEVLQLMYITSCWTEVYKDGYHTTIDTAQRLSGNNKEFRISLLTATGNIIKRSNQIILSKEVQDIIKQRVDDK